MFAREMMKTVFGKVNRSGFHHFANPVPPRKRVSETGFDALGGLMIVSLSAGLAVLMRLILAN